MTLEEMRLRSLAIKAQYDQYEKMNDKDGRKRWRATDYMSGFIKDIGDLSKIIMVKENLRGMEGDIDQKLKHEIGDCFWSLFVICEELGINPEEAMETVLNDLEERFAK